MGISNELFLDRGPRIVNAAWFIGLIIALIILFITLFVVCGIMRRKGGDLESKKRDN